MPTSPGPDVHKHNTQTENKRRRRLRHANVQDLLVLPYCTDTGFPCPSTRCQWGRAPAEIVSKIGYSAPTWDSTTTCSTVKGLSGNKSLHTSPKMSFCRDRPRWLVTFNQGIGVHHFRVGPSGTREARLCLQWQSKGFFTCVPELLKLVHLSVHKAYSPSPSLLSHVRFVPSHSLLVRLPVDLG